MKKDANERGDATKREEKLREDNGRKTGWKREEDNRGTKRKQEGRIGKMAGRRKREVEGRLKRKRQGSRKREEKARKERENRR